EARAEPRMPADDLPGVGPDAEARARVVAAVDLEARDAGEGVTRPACPGVGADPERGVGQRRQHQREAGRAREAPVEEAPGGERHRADGPGARVAEDDDVEE